MNRTITRTHLCKSEARFVFHNKIQFNEVLPELVSRTDRHYLVAHDPSPTNAVPELYNTLRRSSGDFYHAYQHTTTKIKIIRLCYTRIIRLELYCQI